MDQPPCLAVLGLVACSLGGCGEPDEQVPGETTEPQGCDAVLVHGEAAAECSSTDGRCAQVLEGGDAVLWWSVELSYTEVADASLLQTCLEAELTAVGANVDGWILDERWVHVEGTPDQVLPYLDLTVVEDWEVDCTMGEQCGCWDRSVETCSEDAFCWSLSGRPVDLEQQCLLPMEEVQCGWYDGCTDCQERMVSPDGRCFVFNTGCTASGDGWYSPSRDDPSCPSEVFEYPACE